MSFCLQLWIQRGYLTYEGVSISIHFSFLNRRLDYLRRNLKRGKSSSQKIVEGQVALKKENKTKNEKQKEKKRIDG